MGIFICTLYIYFILFIFNFLKLMNEQWPLVDRIANTCSYVNSCMAGWRDGIL